MLSRVPREDGLMFGKLPKKPAGSTGSAGPAFAPLDDFGSSDAAAHEPHSSRSGGFVSKEGASGSAGPGGGSAGVTAPGRNPT